SRRCVRFPRAAARSGDRAHAARSCPGRSIRVAGAGERSRDVLAQLGLEAADPARDLLQRLVTGEIDVDRGDRAVPAAHSVEVGAGAGILLGTGGTDPPPGTTTRIGLLHARFRTMAVAQARDFEAAYLVPRQVGHVDVEDGVGGERIDLQPGNDLDRGT